jgi:adenosylhomocysteine nucleosidase
MRHSARLRRSVSVWLVATAVLAVLGACAPRATTPRVAGRAPATPSESGSVDLVIQGAVDSEVESLVKALTGARRVQIASWTFWRGQLAGRDVVVSRTEVGPINAAVATALAIRTFHPRLIVNQGTAGAAEPGLRVFDIIAGEATVDYSGFRSRHVDEGGGVHPNDWVPMLHRLRLDGDERLALPVFPGDPKALAVVMAQPYTRGRLRKGIIGSGFQFNQEVDRLKWMHSTFDLESEDMESAFAAGAALGLHTPFIAVRIISDSDFYQPGIHPDAAAYCSEFVIGLAGKLPLDMTTR